MKFKVDKDMLIKHRFWVLLAASLPLVMAALLILITSVGAHIEDLKKKVSGKLTEVQQAKEVVGPSVIEVRKKVADDRKASETLVHAGAFKAQEVLATWPDEVEKKFDFQRGRFATDIKIMPAPKDKDSWPANDDSLFHGTVSEVDQDFVVVTDKDGKEAKFQPTLKIKVSKADKTADEKDLWETIANGQFLAITYYRSKYFYDPLTQNEQTIFARSYTTQIHDILRIVDPVDAKGNGTVQFNGWLYNANQPPPPRSKFFTFVDQDWNVDGFIYDEAWTAQEDLWIQREMFQLIRAANDSIAKFEPKGAPVAKDKPTPNSWFEDKTKPITFTNTNYELIFEWIDAGKVAITVKNNLLRRQKLDVYVRVKFNTQNNPQLSSEPILIGGEPLDPRGTGKDSQRKEYPLTANTIKRTGIYGVEQVLTWETAPVKRIDHVAIGSAADDIAHGHKTFPQGSQPYRKDKKKDDGKAADDPMGGMAAAAPGGELGERGFGAGFGGGGQAAGNRGINGVLMDRYLEVSEQSRRLPVGLSLIVDQDHINRVLDSFNNSKLRFLTSQVLLNRYPNSVRPPLVANAAEAPKEAEGPPPAAFSPMGGGDGPRGGSGPKGGGLGVAPMGIPGAVQPGIGGAVQPGMGAGIGGGFAPGMLSAGTEELENNVEMVIYGVVTLYERYPKRKVDGK